MYQVINMNRATVFVLTILLAAGCSNGSVEEPDNEAAVAHTTKPQLPVTISYKIIGTPVVGQPVGIDLQVQSALGPQEISLSYRVNDMTAMQFNEAQPEQVSIAPTNDKEPSLLQVRVIPMREGRLFLNVSATVETESGSMSTVTAIPIEVAVAPRPIQENGELMIDENGESIRSLPAKEN